MLKHNDLESNPEIDYLTRDYLGFRRLLIDRLTLLMPNWNGDHPADLMTVLIEILANAADQLCYYQDAVATEAYLRTARQRVSVKRHARLVDYELHEGCNARAWVQLIVNPTIEKVKLAAGTKFLTALPNQESKVCLSPEAYQQIASFKDIEVFESLYEVNLHRHLNKIELCTSHTTGYCLAPGSTRAYLKKPEEFNINILQKGSVLLLQGPNEANKYMTDYHIVRLSNVSEKNAKTIEIEWYPEDALLFPLQVTDLQGQIKASACGNLVLADHGRRIEGEPLIPDKVPKTGVYRPCLKRQGITYRTPFDIKKYEMQAACLVTQQNPSQALPDIKLKANSDIQSVFDWQVRSTLLESHRFAQHFVLEIEEDRHAYVRFGQEGLGMTPPANAKFTANYRIGNGTRGNIGQAALKHVVVDNKDITAVNNPLPAMGGIDPEPLAQAKRLAPYAFYRQQRAVTLEDCRELLQQHPMVKSAHAFQDWNGSWPIIKIAVVRDNYLPFDASFKSVLENYMADFCIMGDEVHIVPSRYIPLAVKLTIEADKNYLHEQVKHDLRQAFSNQMLEDGTKGFFHPDNFDFAQPVYFSALVARALQVPGVVAVDLLNSSFNRLSDPIMQPPHNKIAIGTLEIACMRNKAGEGQIEFMLK